MKHASPLVFALASFLAACGATDGGNGPATDPLTPGAQEPGDQEPGGTKSPAKANGTVCGSKSSFKGDDLCLAPPDPSEGIQLHVGPANYDDPDALAEYIVQPGEENVRCFRSRVPEAGFYYFKQQNRMRPGSHHMLINLEKGEGLEEGPTTQCDLTSSVGAIPGSQTPSRDFPHDLGPEDAGLSRFLPGEATMASFQLHYVNTGTEPVLREAWINLYKKDESEVKEKLQSVFLVGDIAANIPANSRQTTTLEFTPKLAGETRLFQLNAHSHAHSETFTVWRIRAGKEELLYESFNWNEPEELTYNSVVANAAPNATTKKDGGLSGLQYLQPGDKLRWACDVNNTTNAALRFANEAYTAEMCLLAGGYVSDTPGLMRAVCANGQCLGGR